MNKLLIILLSLALFSCSKQTKSEIESQITPVNELPDLIHTGIDSVAQSQYDSQQEEILHFDTTTIDSKVFIAIYSNFRNLVVVNDKQDTVFMHFDKINGIEFIDFDYDGDKDILLNYLTNVPNIYDLALYNSKTKQFQLVEGFANFPTPEKIKGTKYFYSYHRSGCADSDWASDLFYIKNYLAIRVGNIYGSGCEGNERNGIFISKVTDGVKEQIQEYIREPGYYEDKFDFIQEYWTKNYRLFE